MAARRRSRVPSGRLERLARIGWIAGELALGGLAEGARRLARGRRAAGEAAVSALLSTPNAERLARRLAELRGAAMKLGQLLSLEGDDLLPPEFAEVLGRLRESADVMPPSQVRRVLGREYGRGWRARFAHFDFEPVAAASIGQVHHAVARDGRELALKIQYPGVARSISSDVDNLAALLRVAKLLPVGLDLDPVLAEAKRQLHREADYRIEAANLERYRELLRDEPFARVPRVHRDLTTKRILAMDYVSGRPIEDLRSPEHPQPLRDRVGAFLQHLLFRELFEFRFMQTDPNFGNFRLLPGARGIGLLDLGAAIEIAPETSRCYAELLRATLEEDRERMRRAALALEFLRPGDRPEHVKGLLDLILLVCEPLRREGVYDFGATDLAARARDAGYALAFRQGFLRPPPPPSIFFHRKIAGTFFLCARIRARIDVRSLLLPLLEKAEG